MADLNTEVQLLKKEVSDMKMIYSRLDKAIEKISDVSNSINRMLAVHEEKISQQEEVQIRTEQEINNDIKELHSRISTNNRELMALMSEQHKEQTSEKNHDNNSAIGFQRQAPDEVLALLCSTTQKLLARQSV